MAIMARCPQCATRVRPAATAALPGSELAICLACGCQFPAPPGLVAAADYGQPGAAAGGLKQVDSTERAERPPPPPRSRTTLKVASVIVAVGLIGAGSLFGFDIVREVRQADDRAVARNLNADAQALLAQHRLAEARVRYEELADFIKPRVSEDARLAPMSNDVRSNLARLQGQLSASRAASSSIASSAAVQAAPLSGLTMSPLVHLEQRAASGVATHAGQSNADASHPSAASPPPTPALAPKPAPAGPARRPEAQPVAVVSDGLTDAEVGASIQRGVDWLIQQFDDKDHELIEGRQGKGRRASRDGFHDGADVLCVYALMQCGEAINDPRLNMHGDFLPQCIDTMKDYALDDHFATYSRGLRSTALALYNRKEDNKVLRGDVAALLKTVNKGSYTYYNEALTEGRAGDWDNSNSQYGLLGVWSGAEAEIEVPTSYWGDVEQHWTRTQLTSGDWAYARGATNGRLTMTCAGVASLFVCHDWLDAPKFGAVVGREPFSLPLRKGLQWLEQGDNAVTDRGGQWGYGLYGVERVGLASGFKFFGRHNWYPELARQVLRRQRRDGSWENVVDTSYALLFLSRGRHPVLMNKLRFDGFWANRPRDAANLASFATRQLERPINWQVVPLTSKWTDWVDSPILDISSHIPPKLSDADVDNIRQYVQSGGMLFVHADGDAPVMGVFATELGHRLFPKYELVDVPPNHPLFDSVYRIAAHPPLKMISNGSRILLLFSPTDISRRWQLREQNGQAGKPVFQLGVNMFIYAAGRRDLRNRLDSNLVAEVTERPSMTMRVARVQYAGAWDPEPYAWTRFSRWFAQQTGYAVDAQAVPMRSLDAHAFPIAHLTGTARYAAAPDEIAAVRKYVTEGGVLVVDMTGGAGGFDESIRDGLLPAAFPSGNLRLLQPNHPLLRSGPSGMSDLSRPHLRPYAVEKFGAGSASLDIFKAGKGHVIFTSLDITSGLLNTGAWGIVGYEPSYAQALLKNVVFWTLDGQKDE